MGKVQKTALIHQAYDNLYSQKMPDASPLTKFSGCRNVLRMHMSRDHRSKGHMDQMAKADDAKHYLKMEPIQHQRILPQPQHTPAIQYHESSPILKAPTIKQMVQQTMKQEQQQNHIVIDGEQQHEQLQDYKHPKTI